MNSLTQMSVKSMDLTTFLRRAGAEITNTKLLAAPFQAA